MSSHIRTAALMSLLFVVIPAGHALAASAGQKAVAMNDPDKDGTVDLMEAQAAATALFDKVDTDKEGTVDAKELGGRISKKDLKRSDPDGDGTLDKKEYLAIVEERFKAADPDGDGTLDAKELSTKAGKSLLRLMK